MKDKKRIQYVIEKVVPRYAGSSTFARLPELRNIDTPDIEILGIPFD